MDITTIYKSHQSSGVRNDSIKTFLIILSNYKLFVNYIKPGIGRGNVTLSKQLLIIIIK